MWLKQRNPTKMPPEPGHVNIEALRASATALESQGVSTLTTAYLLKVAPVVEVDRWGTPLPLSAPDQARLDRVFAILQSPYARTRALLKAGGLVPDEADALRSVYPELYEVMWQEARLEMITAGPPFPAWAEGVLAVFFGEPPEVAIGETSSQPAEVGGTKPKTMATQAERRDMSVREQRR